ncbi:MAG: hypothetical protein Q7J16_02125 [Candidatus Cloacimonadales bacterium]|nr:hypothetical protein [Candidatus Cloacimonadales bacterium]
MDLTSAGAEMQHSNAGALERDVSNDRLLPPVKGDRGGWENEMRQSFNLKSAGAEMQHSNAGALERDVCNDSFLPPQ